MHDKIQVGQIYRDVGGVRRGRIAYRQVRVVMVEGHDVMIQNVDTGRSVMIDPSRLLKASRFTLVMQPSSIPNPNEDLAAFPPEQVAA